MCKNNDEGIYIAISLISVSRQMILTRRKEILRHWNYTKVKQDYQMSWTEAVIKVRQKLMRLSSMSQR